MAPKRRRSERGPISLAVRALLELPDTIVAEILRLVDTGRYLDDVRTRTHNRRNTWQKMVLGQWAGTQRMVNQNNLVHRFWSPFGPFWNPRQDHAYSDHLFTIQFPQPLVY